MNDKSEHDLDRIDRQILEALQANGRLTMAELAEKVSLSQSPCWRRVQLLERRGFITGYHARLDRRRVGLGVHGFVCLRMENHTPRVAASFERQVVALPEVIACQNLSGMYDYQLEVVAPDHEGFAKLVREKIRSLPGVKDIYTTFTLREIKAAGALPLQK
jgi:DNA-binding Lrp family transcriptional regulator